MAKAQYIGVNGVARKVKKDYIGVGGVARKVKSGYIGVDGVARKFFSGFDLLTLPFTYTGAYRDRGVETMQDGIFRVIEFTSNGTLTFGQSCIADIFAVGGGASGGAYWRGASGGGGGYTTTQRDVTFSANVGISVNIGAGGEAAYYDGGHGGASGKPGGPTFCTYNGRQIAYAAGGGSNADSHGGYRWLDGGSGGGGHGENGGSNGGNGGGGGGGKGQGTTTREFDLSNSTLYSGGGGGASDYDDEPIRAGAGGAGGGGFGMAHDNVSHGSRNATFYGGGGGAFATIYTNRSMRSGSGYQGICIFRIKAGA